MANKDTAGGLRLVRCRDGGIKTYKVASNYGSAIFVGDAVVLTGTSSTDPRTGDNLIPNVQLATVSSTITGVVVGIVGSTVATAPSIPTLPYIAANTGGLILVCDDPDAVFAIQEDSVGGNIAATAVGEFCDLTFAAGSTTTGLAQNELDSSDAGTGDNVRIIGLHKSPDNEVGANADWLVVINEHTFKAVSTPV